MGYWNVCISCVINCITNTSKPQTTYINDVHKCPRSMNFLFNYIVAVDIELQISKKGILILNWLNLIMPNLSFRLKLMVLPHLYQGYKYNYKFVLFLIDLIDTLFPRNVQTCINIAYRQIKGFVSIRTFMYHLVTARETAVSLSKLAAVRLVSTSTIVPNREPLKWFPDGIFWWYRSIDSTASAAWYCTLLLPIFSRGRWYSVWPVCLTLYPLFRLTK